MRTPCNQDTYICPNGVPNSHCIPFSHCSEGDLYCVINYKLSSFIPYMEVYTYNITCHITMETM